MSGFIILQDGRALSKPNATFDAIVECIAEALSMTENGQTLSQWLLDQRASIRGPGMGRVDVRNLTTENQQLFIQGCRQGFKIACNRTEMHVLDQRRAIAKDELKNSTSMAWLIEPFAVLILMLDAVEEGSPAMELNPYMREIIKPTDQREGPGWDSEVSS